MLHLNSASIHVSSIRPFSEDNFNTFVEMVPSINGRRAPSALPEYAILFQQVGIINDDRQTGGRSGLHIFVVLLCFGV